MMNIDVNAASKLEVDALERQAFWVQNRGMKAKQACEASRADEARKSAQDEPAAMSVPAQVSRASLSPDQIDRMTTFATMIGRGIGCGLDVGPQTRNMGTWLNENVTDQAAKKAYTAVVQTAVESAALQQANGQTLDTCPAVSRGLDGAVLR